MKKHFLIIALLCFVAFGFTGTKKNKCQFLNGSWTEHWGIEMGSDVTDVDELTITCTSTSNITIECTTSDHFKYTDIKFSKNQFKFTMQNMSSSEPFFVYYTFKRVNDDLLKGMIKNSEGVETDVQLHRIVAGK